MRRAAHLLATAAIPLALLCSAATAQAATAETTVPAAPTPAPPPPAGGSMRLTLQKARGTPPFAFVGTRLTVLGTVSPYVAGQAVRVSFYRGARKVSLRTVIVTPGRSGTEGHFVASYASPVPGLVQARAAHYATAAQIEFTARSPAVSYVQVNLGPGAQGPSVRLLQSELDVLHYAVPLTGVFDEGTGQALVAYRKMTGLERIPYAGRQLFELLARGAGSFHVRYPGDGRHVEADLTKQVLAEIEPGGRVHAIYTMSSGKPSTPTVIGQFNVYLKTPGVNSEGMVDSNYFIRGYAIHGYPEVPTYAASHGCLRVPIPDAPAIFAWVREGTPVDVYNEDGSGSSRVRSDAGP